MSGILNLFYIETNTEAEHCQYHTLEKKKAQQLKTCREIIRVKGKLQMYKQFLL